MVPEVARTGCRPRRAMQRTVNSFTQIPSLIWAPFFPVADRRCWTAQHRPAAFDPLESLTEVSISACFRVSKGKLKMAGMLKKDGCSCLNLAQRLTISLPIVQQRFEAGKAVVKTN